MQISHTVWINMVKIIFNTTLSKPVKMVLCSVYSSGAVFHSLQMNESVPFFSTVMDCKSWGSRRGHCALQGCKKDVNSWGMCNFILVWLDDVLYMVCSVFSKLSEAVIQSWQVLEHDIGNFMWDFMTTMRIERAILKTISTRCIIKDNQAIMIFHDI